MPGHPYTLPNDPKVTIREILVWASLSRRVNLYGVMEEFDITNADAAFRLLKLYRWGYLRRKKGGVPRIYHYELTAFGKKSAKKWKK